MATSPTATSHFRSLHARRDHPLRFPCRSLLCCAQETASCLYEATDQAVVLPKPGVTPKPGNATTVPLNDPIAPDIETLLLIPGRQIVADLAQVIEVAPGTELVLDVVNRDDRAHDLEVASVRTRTLQLAGSERLELGVVTEPLHGHCTIGDHDAAGMTLRTESRSSQRSTADEC